MVEKSGVRWLGPPDVLLDEGQTMLLLFAKEIEMQIPHYSARLHIKIKNRITIIYRILKLNAQSRNLLHNNNRNTQATLAKVM